MNACASVVREMARQKDSHDRSNIADTDHTPHRNRHLTVFLKHLRTSRAIPTSIVRRNSGVSVKVLFDHLKRKKIDVLTPEAPSFLSEQVTCRDQEFDTSDSLFSFYFFSTF